MFLNYSSTSFKYMRIFKAALPNQNVSFDTPSEGAPLKVRLLAITPGTELPLRNEQGVTVETFLASEELIRGAVSTSLGGLLTVNHEDPISSRIGIFSRTTYDNGFVVDGEVLCPRWKKNIINGGYQGISVEGSIEGEMSSPSKMQIFAVSFLSESEGACSLINEDGDENCRVEIMSDEINIEAAWAPEYDSLWSYIETDGKINQAKAKKVFLMRTGDGTNRTDWHYPISKMTVGGPEDDPEGLMAAYKRAAQQGETDLFSKIRSRMRKTGMTIPDGLKASKTKLEASFDEKSGKFSAKILDEDNEVLSEKEILIIDSTNVKGVKMPDETKPVEAEVKIEAAIAPAVEAPVIAPVVEPVIEAKAPEVPIIETPAIIPVEVPAMIKEMDPWAVIKTELGIGSKDEFTALKTAADRAKNIDALMAENAELKSFKVDKQKAYLADIYPPALTKDIDSFYSEYVKDPIEFTQKYSSDAIKFAASKNVTLKGSAVESKDTEETKRQAEISGAVNYLYKRNGRSPVR